MAKRKCNAKAQRMWRRRQRLGSAVAMIDYPRDVVQSALINTNRLSPTEIKNRDLVAAALSAVIAEWAARMNRHFRVQAISGAIVSKRRNMSAEAEVRV